MKTINIIKITCVAVLSVMALGANAQEETTNYLNREMTLEREYDPSVQDANKVNTLPEIKEPEIRKIPIDYASITLPAFPQKEVGVLPSGKILANMEYNKRRGYLNLGAGNYMNLNGDVGYHILSSDKDQLRVFFSHRSSNGKVEYLQIDDKVKAKLNDNLGGLDFRHVFENAALRLGAQYGYTAFNYYGLPPYWGTFLPEEGGNLPEPDKETNQVNQTIKAYMGVESLENADLGYKVGIDFTRFSYKYGLGKIADGPAENKINGNIDINKLLGTDSRFGVKADVNYFFYSQPAEIRNPETGELYVTGYENYMEATLTPYYRMEGGNWNLQLGANIMYHTGNDKKFVASPDIRFDIEVATRSVLYAIATGSIQSNSLYDVSRQYRYIDPSWQIEPTRNWLDATIGFKSGIAKGFWFDIFGGYKISTNDVFYFPNRSYTHGDFGNMITSASDFDTNLIFGGAHFKYNYQQLFEIGLKGVYNHWKATYGSSWIGFSGTEDLKHAYGRPKMEFTANVKVNPIDKLSLDLSYYLATDRYTMLQGSQDFKMDNINELNLTGSYRINDTFSVYAKLNNLLFQKYELHYGYPMQGFNAMGGININF